jgi:hypothetical protein
MERIAVIALASQSSEATERSADEVLQVPPKPGFHMWKSPGSEYLISV